ncbi:MAG: hypothetical protein RBT75_05220, partial [Anaerolineae bacterium]|nr:hypothetical protein [Anaerolineae bacterium]
MGKCQLLLGVGAPGWSPAASLLHTPPVGCTSTTPPATGYLHPPHHKSPPWVRPTCHRYTPATGGLHLLNRSRH